MSSVENTTSLTLPNRADCVYTQCYCEENIWHLAKLILETNKFTPDFKCYVIAMSNQKKCIHLWKQITTIDVHNDGLTFWDYHVFLVVKHKDQNLVFDFNSSLPFPVPFAQYAKEAIRHDFPDMSRYFKIIDAQMYVDKFSSDRGHMLEGDRWMAPPPDYPPILNEEKRSNLENIISMDPSNEFGEVFDVDNFIKKLS